jgi:hypothetical protein
VYLGFNVNNFFSVIYFSADLIMDIRLNVNHACVRVLVYALFLGLIAVLAP